ncbi:MAG TPA: Zn-dependent alcohol dehydrogenase [Rhodothermales bacterium]|nr:Zn-dependent alcohol dehydrogenase [Rhodothermales bacterium]
MQTRAAVLYEPNTPFVIETLDLEAPRAGEVLVKVAAAGVCNSHWHLVTGATQHPLPVVPGHEGAGIVQAVGEEVTQVQPGDHVILNWAPSCGHCFYCLHDRPSLCDTYLDPVWGGTMMDGTPRLSKDGAPIYHFCALACFAEYAVVPVESCVRVNKDVPSSVAALIGCAVTTGVGAVLNTAQVAPGSSVAVFGAGGVGLSTVLGARLAGADPVIAIDRVAPKENSARRLGATHFVGPGEDHIEAIRKLTGGRGADYVFDTTGVPAVQSACLDAVRPGGTVVLAGLAPMGSSTDLPGAVITRQEKTVSGTYYGSAHPARDFPHYADLYLRGKLDLDGLITYTYSLDQINEAFADLLAGKLARGVIVM